MTFLLNLLLNICKIFSKSHETYVVQTSDNKLHFVTSTVESHQLYVDPSVRIVEDDGLTLREIEDRFALQLKENMTADSTSMIKKANRIDRIYVSQDGFIDVFGRKVFIDEILAHPMIEEGMYIAATQEHHPSIINKTVVIMAVTRIHLLDLFSLTSRVLKVSQVLYLYETFISIPKKEKEIFLNKKWWKFDSKIIAVYILKEKDGLNFMLRVFNRSDVAVYKHRIQRNSSKKLPILFVCSVVFSIIFYLNRNLRFESCIVKNKLYTGKFIKKDCLIYKVTNSFFKEHKRVYGDLKCSNLVNILNETEGWLYPVIVTENTIQFSPPNDASKEENQNEKSSSSSEACSIENDRNLTNGHRGNMSREDILKDSDENQSMETSKTYAGYFASKIYDEAQQEFIKKFKNDLLIVVQSVRYLHSSGVVHGRISPENIRVSDNGQIKLQSMFDNQGWRSMKQLRNIKNKNYSPDESDDMFSLGCVLHYYLTGYHPFDLRDFIKKERKAFKKTNDRLSDYAQKKLGNEIDTSCKNDTEACTLSDTPLAENGISESRAKPCSQNILSRSKLLNCIFGFTTSAICCFKLRFARSLILLHRPAFYMCRSFVSSLSNLFGFTHKYLNFPVHTTVVVCKFLSFFKSTYKVILTIWGCIVKFVRKFPRLFLETSPASPSLAYHRVLSDEISKYIEYNVLYSTYRIRLEDQVEHDLVYHCIKSPLTQAKFRLVSHPYFWDNSKCLEFICDASDFIETNSNFKPRLERSRKVVFLGSWIDYLDVSMVKSVSSKRTYDHQSICDLIRFIRNCHRHYQELRNEELFGTLEGKLFYYLSHKFPELLMFLYRNPVFKDQPVLRKYYE
ncbi:IRE protein kinase [Vittaforma corneae ATCC 50505]|uniref:IRE protein kinase n=1 Tax=Vittaforma corneae (strain ATCC 50505) TaxID=993615 RepID=L2GKW9_VITCO|nr:IRE protein kinase [Vittaforma corneae ATCC 50505]ELA41279.1 IRE protein kinase [Vittaforma corneae ATCC 50505]